MIILIYVMSRVEGVLGVAVSFCTKRDNKHTKQAQCSFLL